MRCSCACSSGEGLMPYQFYLMLPYLLSILALVLVAAQAAYPQALDEAVSKRRALES